MYLDISDDKKYLTASSNYNLEMTLLTDKLTREPKNSFITKKIVGDHVNTKRKFMNDYGCMPTGLWQEVIKCCKETNIALNLSPKMIDFIKSFQLDYDEYKKFVDNLFEGAEIEEDVPFYPYNYQIEGSYNLIKYQKCCAEMCTSAGKTLMAYLIFKYMYSKGHKKMLYIVPSKNLASQSVDKFELYESYLRDDKINYSWSAGALYSGLTKAQKEKVDTCNILFATYQSLHSKPWEFFKDFTVCIIDEAHHTIASSIRNVLIKSINLQYCFAVTGTFPERETLDYLTIQSYVGGPIVYRYTTNELINHDKKGTPIYVNTQIIDWATDEEKEVLFNMRRFKDKNDPRYGQKCLVFEQKFVNESELRLKYICDLAIKTKKNTMVLFGDVKNGYGRKIYDYIHANSNKTVFYCDGHTSDKIREEMKQMMEDDITGNTVMVASIGTMGEGIDMKNLWCILLVNTAKSIRIVRQIIGRGLRLYKGKDKVVMIDFVDDFRYGHHIKGADKYAIDNYMWKHYKERQNIYKEQKFPVIETYHDIRLVNKNLNTLI